MIFFFFAEDIYLRQLLIPSFLSENTATAAAKSLQSCPTLCDPTDSSPPGSPVPGILQARTLEWVAISFFKAWKWKVKVKLLCHVWLFGAPWTAAYQAPPSMGFSRQGYWSGVPLPSPSENTMKHLSLSFSIDYSIFHFLFKWFKPCIPYSHFNVL